MGFGSLTSTLGLGFVLSIRDDYNRTVDKSRRNLGMLKKASGATADAVEGDVASMASAMERYNQQLVSGRKMMMVGLGILSLAGIATKVSSVSEDALSNVKSLLVGTGVSFAEAESQIAGLKIAIDDLGDESRVPLRQLETASYDLVSANLTLNEAIGVLPSTAHLAVAGLGSMEDATLSVTKAYNTFGQAWEDSLTPAEKALRIANTYAGTIAGLQTTLPKLTIAMQNAAPDAVSLGAGIEETAVLLGLLQTKGLEASRSGMAVAAMFRELVNLSKKSKKAVGPLAGLGLENAEGSLRPIADIIEDIEKRLSGLGAVKRAEILSAAFGDEGSRALKLMIGQSDALREYVERIKNGVPLMDMMNARQSSFGGIFQQTKNSMLSMVDLVGSGFLPIASEMAFAFKNIATGVREFSEEHPTMMRMFLGIAVGAGTVMTLVGSVKMLHSSFMLMRGAIPFFSGGITLLRNAMVGLGIGVNSSLWPILAVVAGLAALLYLTDKIAGTNILGEMKDFFFPKIPNVSLAPDLSMVGGAVVRPELPISDFSAGSGSQPQIINDYSTTRINTKIDAKHADAKQLSTQLSRQTKQVTRRGTGTTS